MPSKLLIIDDEELFREDLATLLRQRGFECRTASDAQEGLNIAKDFLPDIILSDIVMPKESGIEMLDKVSSMCPDTSIIMMTAFGTLETAISAFRKGAVDYILKPLIIDDLLNKIHRISEQKRLLQEIKYLRRKTSEDIKSISIISQSNLMRKVIDLIKKVAPKNSTVLITGESGTGKELVANAIHELSDRKNEPFIAINCSGFQESLLESELFGYVKGAFTGATIDKKGFFEIAGQGTIFLDEIAEMPFSLQTKLLRVLEQREFYPVGGTKLVPIEARIIAATNKDLRSLIKKNRFREDLFYRIAIFEINLPPLRKRMSDLPALAEYFIHKFNEEMKTRYVGLSTEVLQAFMSYIWPGNVRELRNVIERAMILSDGHQIKMDGLPLQMRELIPINLSEMNLKEAVHNFEKTFIIQVLKDCNWNKEEAARKLEINPSTLYRKMAELNVNEPG